MGGTRLWSCWGPQVWMGGDGWSVALVWNSTPLLPAICYWEDGLSPCANRPEDNTGDRPPSHRLAHCVSPKVNRARSKEFATGFFRPEILSQVS